MTGVLTSPTIIVLSISLIRSFNICVIYFRASKLSAYILQTLCLLHKLTTLTCIALLCLLLQYLFTWESARAHEHTSREVSRRREKQDPQWARSQTWDSILEPKDHDPSWRQTTNWATQAFLLHSCFKIHFDKSIRTSAFFSLPFAGISFASLYSQSVCILILKWVCYRQHTDKSFFLNPFSHSVFWLEN